MRYLRCSMPEREYRRRWLAARLADPASDCLNLTRRANSSCPGWCGPAFCVFKCGRKSEYRLMPGFIPF